MVLTFSPALKSLTSLPIPLSGRASFRFTAAFSSSAEYEQARREGTRVEMWTNLPVGRKVNEWHALPFTYAEPSTSDRVRQEKMLSLVSSPAVPDHDYEYSHVTLDITIPNAQPMSRYSFTYRLVRPWGAIEWLGAYKQNGDLVLEEYDARFAVADGFKLEHNTIVSQDVDVDAVQVAMLNTSVKWTCWGFNDNGCTGPSADISLSPSGAALLVPHYEHSYTGLADTKPVLLSADHGALSIAPSGGIVLHHGASLTITTIDSLESFATVVEQVLPDYVAFPVSDGFGVIASKNKYSEELPVTLSIVPVTRHAWKARHTDVCLSSRDALDLLGDVKCTEVVLASLTIPTFTAFVTGEDEDLVIRVSPLGAQCVLSPVYSLVVSDPEDRLDLALLSPFSSPSVELIKKASPLALLTPPPSPPPLGRFDARAISSLSIAQSAPSLSDLSPSPQIKSETSELPQPVVTPLTPTSPSPREEDEFVTKDESAVTTGLDSKTLVQPAQRTGLLRLALAFVVWHLRSSVARVLSLLGGNFLLLLACRFFGLNLALQATATQTHVDATDSVDRPESNASPQEVSYIECRGSANGANGVQLSGDDLDGVQASDSEERKEDASISDDLFIPRESPRGAERRLVHAPIPAPTSSVRSLEKARARFVANVPSEVVTLLAQFKSGHSKLELTLSVNGEHQPTHSCSQISENARLFEFRLPVANATIEVNVV